ncbi:tripartite tricarboxylate transporter permease [Candidatus Woesearchaeota archaeon]|nr:tripartite tricarboxylate transporter permease [Candidatus Woesearchaeota archaeon]
MRNLESLISFFIYILAAFAGVLAGIFTGILPGLHINLVAVVVAAVFSGSVISGNSTVGGVIGSFAVATFILAMSISHVFHEFLPSVFLGFSESDAALAVLPGHRLLLRGQGRKAVMLAAFGCLTGVLALVLLSPVLVLAIKPIFNATNGYVWLILAAVAAFHLLRSKNVKSAAAKALTFSLSGAFGVAVFSLPGINQPLLPMFSGLFGISSLIGGLLNRSAFPLQQKNSVIKIKKPLKIAKLAAVGLFSSSLMGIFPALGPAQAAMLGTSAFRKVRASAYIFLLGIIASASMLIAVLTLYSFGKARNGSIAVMGSMLGADAYSTSLLFMLLMVAVIAAAASCISVIFMTRFFLLLITRVNYSVLSWLVIIFIAGFVAAISGPIGLLVLAAATAIGMFPVLTKSSRQLLMGCLMVPVIGYYI